MKMSRTQLFSEGFSILMRCGPMWLVAVAVAVVDLLLGLVLPAAGILGTVLGTLRGALTRAFLTGALIVLANDVADHRPTSFGGGFAAGARFFLPLLGVGLILALPSLAFGQLVSLFLAPLASQIPQNPDVASLQKMLATLGLMLCVLLPLLLAWLLVSGITGALGVGAERAVALEGANVWRALKRGWDLLTEKLGDIFVIGLIMLGVWIVFYIFFGCAAVIVGLGASLASLGNATSEVSRLEGNPVFNIIHALLTIPIEIWFSVVWTLAFRRWQGRLGDVSPFVEGAVPPPAIPPIEGQ